MNGRKDGNEKPENASSSTTTQGEKEVQPVSESPKDKNGNPGSDNFSDLPKLVKHRITSFTDLADASAVARTSRKNLSVFKSEDMPLDDVSKLLKHVAFGEQAAIAMLKQNPVLAKNARNVTDRSGRVFEKITPLQYAYWSLDRGEFYAIKQHLSPAEIEKQLTQHLDKENPPAYVKQHGLHFDAAPFSQAIQDYNTYISTHNPVVNGVRLDFNQLPEPQQNDIKKLFLDIGKEQRNLPIHMITWYTRKHSSQKFSIGCVIPHEEYEEVSSKDVELYPLEPNSGLGYDYTMCHITAYDITFAHSQPYYCIERADLYEMSTSPTEYLAARLKWASEVAREYGLQPAAPRP